MASKPKQTVEAHLREQLAITRKAVVDNDLHIQQLQKRNDNQSSQLQNMLNIEQTDKDRITLLAAEVQAANGKLVEAESKYQFRHNQELETSRKLGECQRALSAANFQHEMTVREVTRLLLLEQFTGGKENELMLTRSRNRLLDALVPTTQGECQQVVSGQPTEGRQSESALEETQS